MGRARRAGGGVEGSRRAVERRGDDDAAVHGDADDAAFPLRGVLGGVLSGVARAERGGSRAPTGRPPAFRADGVAEGGAPVDARRGDAGRGDGVRLGAAESRGEERAPEVRGGGGRAPRRARGRGARGGAESRGEAHALDALEREVLPRRAARVDDDARGGGGRGPERAGTRRERQGRGASRARGPGGGRVHRGVVARGRRRAPGRGRGRRRRRRGRRRRGRRRRGLRGSLDADVRPPPGRVSTFERRFARIAALSRALLLLILPAVLPPGKAREHRGHDARPDERAHRAQRAHVRVGAARRDVGRATRTRSAASETQKKKARSARASDIFRARRIYHPRVVGSTRTPACDGSSGGSAE
jgi:hypothetical protein